MQVRRLGLGLKINQKTYHCEHDTYNLALNQAFLTIFLFVQSSQRFFFVIGQDTQSNGSHAASLLSGATTGQPESTANPSAPGSVSTTDEAITTPNNDVTTATNPSGNAPTGTSQTDATAFPNGATTNPASDSATTSTVGDDVTTGTDPGGTGPTGTPDDAATTLPHGGEHNYDYDDYYFYDYDYDYDYYYNDGFGAESKDEEYAIEEAIRAELALQNDSFIFDMGHQFEDLVFECSFRGYDCKYVVFY